jgi:hypothetical protein
LLTDTSIAEVLSRSASSARRDRPVCWLAFAALFIARWVAIQLRLTVVSCQIARVPAIFHLSFRQEFNETGGQVPLNAGVPQLPASLILGGTHTVALVNIDANVVHSQVLLSRSPQPSRIPARLSCYLTPLRTRAKKLHVLRTNP